MQHPIHAHVEAAYNAYDLEEWTRLYEKGGVLVAPNGENLSGHTAIRSALAGFLSLRGTVIMETVYAIEVDHLVLLRGKFTLRYTDENNEPKELSGNTSEVARCGADGKWKFVIDHPSGAD